MRQEHGLQLLQNPTRCGSEMYQIDNDNESAHLASYQRQAAVSQKYTNKALDAC